MARRFQGQSERRPTVKRLLKTDPTICVIKTPAGLFRIYKPWFDQLCRLPWLHKTAPRVATIANGFAVIISDKEFHAYRINMAPPGPRMATFAEQVDHAWIYTIASRSLSPLEREQEAARAYALYCLLEPA